MAIWTLPASSPLPTKCQRCLRPAAVRKVLEERLFSCCRTKTKNPETIVVPGFFGGGDKRDRTADLLNSIQALSQLSYTPTGKVYLIRKQHECQERFFDSAKKICAAVLPPAQTGFFRLLRSRLTVTADDPGDGGGQLFVAVRVEMLAIERAHLRERSGVKKAQTVRLGDHAVLLRHALRHGE